jgi:hypothetical protein
MHPLPRALAAPPDISLFRRRTPCSGIENSLFRTVQGIGRKLLDLQSDLGSAADAQHARIGVSVR